MFITLLKRAGHVMHQTPIVTGRTPCQLILIDDEERPDIRHTVRQAFYPPGLGFYFWDGSRASKQEACGGGRRVVRKRLAE